MLRKTLRSALSLVLVFCLLLGMGGNAIALAVENPASGAIDQIDAKVNATIAELEALIADLEKEVETQEQNLADAQAKLESGKEDLAAAQATLDEKKGLLEDARAELDKLQGKLDEADTMLGKLEDKVAKYQADLDQAQIDLDDAQLKLDDAQTQLNNAHAQLAEKRGHLTDAQTKLDEAQAQLDELKDQLAEYDLMTIEEIIEMVVAEMMGEGEAHPFYTIVTVSDEVQDGGYYCAIDETWTRPTLGLKVDVAVMPGTVVLIYGGFAMGGPNVGDYLEGVVLQTWSAEEAPTATNITEAQEELDDAQAQLDDAQTQLDNAQTQLDDAQTQLDNAQAEKDAAQGLKDGYQAKLNDAKLQLKDAQDQVAWAKGEYQKLYDTIDEIETTIDNYQAKADEADAAVVKAEEALPKAEVALVEAKEALADAKALVENIKTTYATLHNAVTDPEVSVDFVRETVNTLNEQVKALWASALTLQTSLHELIDAYKELEGFAIDPIVIEDYYFAGLTIEKFEVGEYHYEEADFHFAGYEFDGYTVDPVTVEGYTFEGFTAPEMPAQLTEISNTLDNVIAKVTTLNEAVSYYVAAAKPYIAKALDVAEETLGITYETLKNNLNKEGVKKVYNWLYNNPDKVCGLVEKFGVYGLEKLVQYGPYALDLLENHSDMVILGMKLTVGATYAAAIFGAKALGYVGDKLDFLADYKDDVVAAARKLYAKYGDEAKALVMVYVEYLELEERYYNATHADVTFFHDSLYVAIGDQTAVSNSYVDELADMLGIAHMTENLAEYGLTVEAAMDLVNANADLIAKADLITLSFSNINASTDLLNALVADYENSWTTEVGQGVSNGIDKVLAAMKARLTAAGVSEENVALVDEAGDLIYKALNKLNAYLVEEGLDEATVNMVMEATEAYAAAYIARAAWYPALVKTIREVNPDAQVVIVGTYNDLEGVVVEVAGREFNVGQITRCLTAVANLENLLQAFVCENVTYVHASAVETEFEAAAYENINNLGILMSVLNDEMLPSEAGHKYIAEEIYDALNVEYKIWGDVNGDHKVNCRDARLILQYAAGLITEDDLDLTWGDVNGDGKVNSRDARLILQLRAGMIEHFPVCNLSEE